LLLASKLLDAAPLSLRHIERYFAAIASREEVCMAELNILHYLHWDANAFTALDFLRTALQLVPAPELRASITARAEAAHEAALLGAWRRMAAARARAPARADALLSAGCACARAPAAPSHRPFPVSAHPPAPPRPAPRRAPEYAMLRFHPCSVGLACIEVACEAHGFDVTPLRDGLAARGIFIDVSGPAGGRARAPACASAQLCPSLPRPRPRPRPRLPRARRPTPTR
jgi:hypothetical protein